MTRPVRPESLRELPGVVFLAAALGGAGCGVFLLLASILELHLCGQIAAAALGTLVAAIVAHLSTQQMLCEWTAEEVAELDRHDRRES